MGISVYDSPVGRLTLVSRGDALCEVRLSGEKEQGDGGDGITALAERELSEYFEGKRRCFDIPLCPEGTAFEKCVWGELMKVPFGASLSYGELAARIGRPSACRAVGRAVGRNPILILIPCHRVLAAGQRLGGFSAGPERKMLLLKGENISFFL